MNGHLNHENNKIKNTYYEVELQNGNKIHEKDKSWTHISKEELIRQDGKFRTVKKCSEKIKRIKIGYKNLEAGIDIGKDEEAYQAIVSEAILTPTNKNIVTHIGRKVGKIKDGEIIEEKFINFITEEIQGFKK